MNKLKSIFTIMLLTTLTACGGGNGGGSNDNAGSLTVGITDGPVEQATAVVVSFTGIELQGAEKTLITFDEAKTINLLDYQGEDRVLLLDNQQLESGDYQWLRLALNIADSYIEIDGNRHSLEIPSGAQTGLKLNRGFTIGAGSSSNFTIEFDLRKSVHQEGTGDYKLRPTLRLVNNLDVGVIAGVVSDNLITAVSCDNGVNNDTGNVAYLFTGSDTLPQDIQGNDQNPLTTATVSYNDNSEQYEFTIAYVPVGNYTVAFSCDAINDINTDDNSVGNGTGNPEVSFSASSNISVVAQESVQVVLN